MKTLLPFYFLLKSLFAGCHEEIKHNGFKRDRIHRISRIGNIDTVVKETSGMAFYKGLFWTLGDSGTKPEIYGLDYEGKCVEVLAHPELKNKDWEELAIDTTTGRFFIGDIGNNSNKRKDLKIYVLDSAGHLDIIPVSYALQKAFPPPKPLRNYDCEAMVFVNDSLFLFSKNRGTPLVKWYGFSVFEHTAPLFPAREFFLKGMITAAAYDHCSGQLVLLAYGKLYWFKVSQHDILNAQPWLIKKKSFYGQIESLCFDDKGVLFMTNEKGKRWKIEKKKSIP